MVALIKQEEHLFFSGHVGGDNLANLFMGWLAHKR